MLVCLSMFVCLYPTNVKTTEPIGPKFCVEPQMTPGKVYGCSKLQKCVSKSFLFFVKFWKCAKKYYSFVIAPREDAHRWALIKKWNRRCRPKSPKSLVYYISTSKLHSTKHSWSSSYKSLLTCKHQLIILVSPNC